MEYYNNDPGGASLSSTDEEIDKLVATADLLLLWGYRLLWPMLYIGFIVPMGYLTFPTTIPFYGALLCAILPILFSKKELFTIEEDKPKTIGLYDESTTLNSEGDSNFLHSMPTPSMVETESNEGSTMHPGEGMEA